VRLRLLLMMWLRLVQLVLRLRLLLMMVWLGLLQLVQLLLRLLILRLLLLLLLLQGGHDVLTGQNRFPGHNGFPRRGLLRWTSGYRWVPPTGGLGR
jgi:hypothetical protein